VLHKRAGLLRRAAIPLLIAAIPLLAIDAGRSFATAWARQQERDRWGAMMNRRHQLHGAAADASAGSSQVHVDEEALGRAGIGSADHPLGNGNGSSVHAAETRP
jgi:hypothetical protein